VVSIGLLKPRVSPPLRSIMERFQDEQEGTIRQVQLQVFLGKFWTSFAYFVARALDLGCGIWFRVGSGALVNRRIGKGSCH